MTIEEFFDKLDYDDDFPKNIDIAELNEHPDLQKLWVEFMKIFPELEKLALEIDKFRPNV